MTPPIDPAALRRLCEQATTGEREIRTFDDGERWLLTHPIPRQVVPLAVLPASIREADVEFSEKASPAVVLALLDEIERAEARVAAWESFMVLRGLPMRPYAVLDSDPVNLPTPEAVTKLLDTLRALSLIVLQFPDSAGEPMVRIPFDQWREIVRLLRGAGLDAARRGRGEEADGPGE